MKFKSFLIALIIAASLCINISVFAEQCPTAESIRAGFALDPNQKGVYIFTPPVGWHDKDGFIKWQLDLNNKDIKWNQAVASTIDHGDYHNFLLKLDVCEYTIHDIKDNNIYDILLFLVPNTSFYAKYNIDEGLWDKGSGREEGFYFCYKNLELCAFSIQK